MNLSIHEHSILAKNLGLSVGFCTFLSTGHLHFWVRFQFQQDGIISNIFKFHFNYTCTYIMAD